MKKRKLPVYDRNEMQMMIDLAENGETSDRTLAIVCMAHLEDALAELLRANLEGYSGDIEKDLFSPGGSAPLSTFRNKVVMAEAMGVIYPDFARELSRMATIRNRFAHHLTVDSFDHEQVRDHVEQLHSLREVALLVSAALILPTAQMIAPTRRRRFCYSAVVAALALNGEETVMIDRINLLHRLS
jgi:hypothetical protein